MQHTKETVGFIGPGLMGRGIAKNIVEKGYDLSFYSRRHGETAKDLEGLGAFGWCMTNTLPPLRSTQRA